MRRQAGHRWLFASSVLAVVGLIPWVLSAWEVATSRCRPFAFLLRTSVEPGVRLRLLHTSRQAWNDDSPPPPPPRPPRSNIFLGRPTCFRSMLSLFLGPCLSPLEADSFMGVEVQEEVMEPAFLGSKLKKRVSFQEDVDNAAPDSSGTSGEATRATESSPESTVGSGRDGSTRSHGRLSLTDRVVRRHNRNFLRARLAVVAFLESNGFSEIDVNCKKSSSFGLVRTYPLHEAAKQDLSCQLPTITSVTGQRLHQLLASAPWCRSLEEGLLRPYPYRFDQPLDIRSTGG
eukprot:symbB.v1.2.013246.t1/scaffold891.1/size154755/14